jgi:Ca-activated chloride channel family protein
MRHFVRALLICSFVIAAVGGTHGAGLSIRGTVVDVTGAGIPGTAVQLTRGNMAPATAVTDVNGAFAFADLAAGDYTLTATLSGFKSLKRRVRLNAAGVHPPLRLVMELSGLVETITVAAQSSVISTQMSQVADWRTGGPASTATYDPVKENGFKRVTDAPLSTLSIDVDTASYANVRRFLSEGELPPPDAVRVEELINYFRFDYPLPDEGRPFSVTTEVGACPWNARHQLALIGLRSKPIAMADTPPRNLVFLLDVSGSMQPWNRLPRVQSAMLMLVDTLRDQDRVAVVVYAGSSGVVLPSTSGSRKAVIERAIRDLEAGGSTNGAEGIDLAYAIAAENFIQGGVNRVILATDGDFNVGVSSPGDLVRLIERKRKGGVFLSVLGVGDDNLKDATMEKLANAGNGNYSYLDSLAEARRVLVAQAGATLTTAAKDVKIQVEFNPQRIQGYRLIGYEDRVLAPEEFKDDLKDAGEMGAGHYVTALYEIIPAGVASPALPTIGTLKYQAPAQSMDQHRDELMTIQFRYKRPEGTESLPMEVPVNISAVRPSVNLGFAAAVAEFGMLLRDSPFKKDASWRQAADLATANRGPDPDGSRAEFIGLVGTAASLKRRDASHVK